MSLTTFHLNPATGHLHFERRTKEPAATTVIMMSSLAQSLPEEVLTAIFQYTSPIHCEDGSRCFEAATYPTMCARSADQRRFALVCKSWSGPALKQLYKVVLLCDCGPISSFHSRLQDDPAVANNVRHLEVFPEDMPPTSSDTFRQLVDIVRMCDRLRCFAIKSELGASIAYTDLRSCKRIEKLHLEQVGRSIHNHFGLITPLLDAYCLRELNLYDCAIDGKSSAFPLPNLEFLTLEEVTLVSNPETPFFTTLGSLKSFTVRSPLTFEEGDSSTMHRKLDSIFPSIGSKLTSLTFGDQNHLALRNRHFQHLPNLVHLVYQLDRSDEASFVPAEESLSFDSLPSTLQTLQLEWPSSYEQAIWFFKAFQSPTFLSNLRSAPVLARMSHRFQGREAEFERQQRKAISTLRRRGLARSVDELASMGTLRPTI